MRTKSIVTIKEYVALGQWGQKENTDIPFPVVQCTYNASIIQPSDKEWDVNRDSQSSGLVSCLWCSRSPDQYSTGPP